jgi:hypothetical protein
VVCVVLNRQDRQDHEDIFEQNHEYLVAAHRLPCCGMVSQILHQHACENYDARKRRYSETDVRQIEPERGVAELKHGVSSGDRPEWRLRSIEQQLPCPEAD